MARFAALLYGAVAYVTFLGTFLYAIGFVGNFVVPKTIDSGPEVPLGEALLVNVLLLALFAVQHSIMARPWFKRWLTRFIPMSVERSTFVLLTNIVLVLLYWQWRPIKDIVWNVEGTWIGTLLTVLFWLGWLLVLLSTFMISHFDLFGLRQVYLNFKSKEYTHLSFTTAYLYKFVRHPLLLGFIIAFWAAPVMTIGHLLFAAATTGYMLVAVRLEEADLVAFHGQVYEEYRQHVPMLIPTGRKMS